MRERRRDRGTTLIEILIAMGVMLVGMMAMIGVLTSSITASSTAQKLSQAEVRALTIMESIRQSPNAALDCLVTNSPNNWSTVCEPICRAGLGAAAKPDSCIYSMHAFAQIKAADAAGTNVGLAVDRSDQQYAVDWTPGVACASTGSGSCAMIGGTNNSIYDIQIVIGWNNDGSINTGAGYHRVTLRSAVSTL